MAVAIWSPANNSGMRKPNGAVFRDGAPAAVIVKVFVTDHVRGDVTGRSGMVGVTIAVGAPAVKVIVVIAEALDIGVELIGTGKRAGLASMNGIGRTASRDFSLA